ncbi:MAG TPA: nuclear transport factor 2 family protein, partial [Acidimicrobiales bacterium]|nr:nuclear transport factor 2 family protein [Acidimicrobiales bacterium]
MNDTDERRARDAIEELTIEFWYRVDHCNGQGVADLFCEDGVYSVANGQNAGRAAIAESYRQRAARGPRLSRHVQTNLRVTFASATEAQGMSILTLWADDEVAPLGLKMPISVTDVQDEYEKEGDGVWRIRHRHLAQVFLGDRPGVLPMGKAEP